MGFIYIETKDKIESLVTIIFDVLGDQIKIIKYQIEKQSLVLFFKYNNVDIESVLSSLASDLYIDFLIYESKNYLSEEIMLNDLKLFLKIKEQFNLNYEYYNNKRLLEKTYLLKNEYLNKLVLGKYYYDSEMKKTIITFLNSNQNAIEAARELYVHRNTINMRLSKFYEETGFNIKEFKDAFLIYWLYK